MKFKEATKTRTNYIILAKKNNNSASFKSSQLYFKNSLNVDNGFVLSFDL